MARLGHGHARRNLLLTAAASLLAACGSPAVGLRVLAAASLTGVLDEAARLYAAETGAAVEPGFAATSLLARQIEAGAAGDVLVSADKTWMDRLEKNGFLRPDTRRDLAGNSLVLAARSEEIKSPLDCERIALADPAHVPAGVYAREALSSLGQWAAVEKRVLAAVDARAAAAYVDRGDVPCAVLYASDLLAAPKARRAFDFPPGSHAPIRYPASVLAGSKRPAEAARFLAWLAAPERRALWERHGFLVLDVPL